MKAALLGTNRAELPAVPVDAALDDVLNQIPRQDPAATLLAIAGTLTLHSQAGWQPPQGATRPPVPALPGEPVCSTSIGSQIDALLEGSQAALLPEMLEALAKTNHCAPNFLLPNLLDKGTKLAKLRPSILAVLGKRGRWLAGQNPEWGWASLEIETWSGLLTQWQTAVPKKRQALLRQLRLTEPERGRHILEQTWKSNNDLTRNQLIKLLDINLSLADEPFLELALDDRNHLVRRAAADLLARLPQSRLAKRMCQHVTGILSWTPKKERAITVRLPASFSPAMLRDGMPAIKAEDRTRLHARLLTQTISRVPLSYWLEQWQKTPLEIAHAVLNSTWPRSLTAAFGTAAIRQQDESWAAALITTNQFNTAMGRLVPVLSAETCFALMQAATAQSTEIQRPNPLFIFLQHWQADWTMPMGQFWLERFVHHLENIDSAISDPTLTNLLKRFGQKCPPELADTAVAQLTQIPNLNNHWQKTVHTLCQTLLLRQKLLAEMDALSTTTE